MISCPQCNEKTNEIDFDYVMDELSKKPMQGEYIFSSKCCNQQLRAYSDSGTYYIEGNPNSSDDTLKKPQEIGRR